jgi:hypothetical protein
MFGAAEPGIVAPPSFRGWAWECNGITLMGVRDSAGSPLTWHGRLARYRCYRNSPTCGSSEGGACCPQRARFGCGLAASNALRSTRSTLWTRLNEPYWASRPWTSTRDACSLPNPWARRPCHAKPLTSPPVTPNFNVARKNRLLPVGPDGFLTLLSVVRAVA